MSKSQSERNKICFPVSTHCILIVNCIMTTMSTWLCLPFRITVYLRIYVNLQKEYYVAGHIYETPMVEVNQKA
jgi:hypothetical protein